MNSDELGEKGQQRFGEWCADVGLFCNRSIRDRAGWDFVVDFPHQPSALSLDHRLGPISCVVQLKTVLKKTSSIRLRLDMAERLAKEAKPAFIIAPVVDGLEFVELRAWHIRGKHLEAILKRLRAEQFKGNAVQVGNRHITFRLDGADSIGLGGSALVELFKAACPDGMPAYAEAKAVESALLGYAGAPFHMTFLPEDTDPLKLLDFFLGKAQDAPGLLSGLSETRFGITLPVPGTMDCRVQMTLNPPSDGEVILRMRAPSLRQPLVERAEIYLVPFEVDGHRRLEFRASHLTVTMTAFPHGQAQVQVVPNRPPDAWTVGAWARHAVARYLSCVTDLVLDIEMVNAMGGIRSMPLPAPDVGTDWARGGAALQAATRMIELVTTQAGDDPDRLITAPEMDKACQTITALVLLDAGESITFEGTGFPDALEDLNVVVTGEMLLAGRRFAWHGLSRMRFTNKSASFLLELVQFRFEGARRLGSEELLSSYAGEAMEQNSAPGAFWVGWTGEWIGELVGSRPDSSAESPRPAGAPTPAG